MNYLVDTNVLARLAESGHPMHQTALDAVKLLVSQGHTLHIVPQNLYEFWVVCSRPTSANGLGKSLAETVAEISTIRALFLWVDDTPDVFRVWLHLVSTTPVLGKNAHDARLVAAMSVHGLTHILTFNDRDFRNYPGVTSVSPVNVITP